MAYAYPGDGALDYFPCRYGTSRLLFRGPRRDLAGPYVAVLGGTETYGKFVPRPYPDLLEVGLGMPVVNLGCLNAGIDVYLNDPSVIEVASHARATVVQLVGAQNLTNRFYAVHPRRNDRFLSASPLLRALYREVDFTEFTFTRHMLRTLHSTSAERFEAVVAELRAVWLMRMRALLALIPGQRVLLWMADQPPPRAGGMADVDHDPLFVDAGMVAAVRSMVSAFVEVRPLQGPGDLTGMAFAPLDAPAAAALPGPAAHREVAQALIAGIRTLL